LKFVPLLQDPNGDATVLDDTMERDRIAFESQPVKRSMKQALDYLAAIKMELFAAEKGKYANEDAFRAQWKTRTNQLMSEESIKTRLLQVHQHAQLRLRVSDTSFMIDNEVIMDQQ
jgi:hypothetical protein